MEKQINTARVWQWTEAEGMQSHLKKKVECAANKVCMVPIIFEFIYISFCQLYNFFFINLLPFNTYKS